MRDKSFTCVSSPNGSRRGKLEREIGVSQQILTDCNCAHLWIYDLRINKHFTLKENPLKRSDLDDFVACYNPKNRHERKPADRFRSFTYEELTKRDP